MWVEPGWVWVAAYHEIQASHLGGKVTKETVKEEVFQHRIPQEVVLRQEITQNGFRKSLKLTKFSRSLSKYI